MDPDANVKEQKEIRKRRKEKKPLEGDSARLEELQRALWEWRLRGGFPPQGGWR